MQTYKTLDFFDSEKFGAAQEQVHMYFLDTPDLFVSPAVVHSPRIILVAKTQKNTRNVLYIKHQVSIVTAETSEAHKTIRRVHVMF